MGDMKNEGAWGGSAKNGGVSRDRKKKKKDRTGWERLGTQAAKKREMKKFVMVGGGLLMRKVNRLSLRSRLKLASHEREKARIGERRDRQIAQKEVGKVPSEQVDYV